MKSGLDNFSTGIEPASPSFHPGALPIMLRLHRVGMVETIIKVTRLANTELVGWCRVELLPEGAVLQTAH